MDETSGPSDLSDPPDAPGLPRRVRLYWPQRIGIPLLALLPVLALFGVFGEVRERGRLARPPLQVEVEFPARMRAGQHSEILVLVRNLSDQPLDTLTLAFDTSYLHRFRGLSFTPSPVRGYEVDLVGLRPRGAAAIRVAIQGYRPGRHRGRLEVVGAGVDVAHLPIETFVFP